MNYATLKVELAADPLGRGYVDMSDDEVVASLGVADQSRTKAIPSTELLAWAGAENRFKRIEDAAQNTDLEEAQSVAKAAELLIRRDTTSLDLSLPDRALMVGSLVAVGVLTQADSDALYALGTETIDRATELGLGQVLPGHVQKARA